MSTAPDIAAAGLTQVRGRVEASLLLVAAGFFFLPFMNLRPDSVLFTFSDLLFLLSAVALMLRERLTISPFGSMTPFWYLSVALLIGGLLVSSIFSDATARWLSVSSQYAFSLLLLPMIVAVGVWANWITLARAFVFGMVGMEILTFAILNYYGWDYQKIRPIYGPEFLTGAGRVSGFIGGANLHAALLCMCMPFVYYLRSTGKMSFPVFVMAAGALITGVFYSASATGFGSLIIVSLTFLALSRVRISPQFLAAVATAAAVFVLAGAPLPKAFDKRVGSALESGQIEEAGTFADRVELIDEAWEMANKSLLVGIGADNYRNVSDYRMPVHNAYLLLWVEGGTFAILGWLGLLGVLVFGGLATLRRRPLDAALALSVLAVFLIFSIAAPHMYARVWFAPALLAVAPAFQRLRSGG